MIAASTGPAQGTNTAPSASPTPYPLPLFVTSLRRASLWKGFSSSCSKRGTSSPTPMAMSTAMPDPANDVLRQMQPPSRSEPTSVTSVKLVISPAITR